MDEIDPKYLVRKAKREDLELIIEESMENNAPVDPQILAERSTFDELENEMEGESEEIIPAFKDSNLETCFDMSAQNNKLRGKLLGYLSFWDRFKVARTISRRLWELVEDDSFFKTVEISSPLQVKL
eukprot:TRINITY_DN10499_c0_g1_i2.p1 TRINITY_DN10499_c0_g1~~TRINITY_DN10499_c0_g1_i2.p1  ORF type:complete len:127 (+),score=29.38 TRINITY_DN10499_c0_g1_i2:112-492(+)